MLRLVAVKHQVVVVVLPRSRTDLTFCELLWKIHHTRPLSAAEHLSNSLESGLPEVLILVEQRAMALNTTFERLGIHDEKGCTAHRKSDMESTLLPSLAAGERKRSRTLMHVDVER